MVLVMLGGEEFRGGLRRASAGAAVAAMFVTALWAASAWASPGDGLHAAVAPAAVPAEPGRVKWRFRLDGDYSLQSAAIGADGTVYVNVTGGKLYAVNPDGTQRWVFQAGLGGGAPGPVSVGADGNVYVAGLVPSPTGSGNVDGIFAVNPDGTLRWLFDDTGYLIIAGPNVGPDGNVYAVAESPGIGLFSLTPAGQTRFATGAFAEYGALGEEIAFGASQLYFGFDMATLRPSSTLFAYDLNGNLRFEASGMADPVQPAVGPNGHVVVQTFPVGQGLSLSAFSPQGARLWDFYEFPGNTEEDPDVGPDNVAYTVRNLSTLLALNPDGGVRWRYVDPGILFEPVVSPTNSLVFMGGRITYGQPGFFLAVGTNGAPQWRVDLPDEPGFEPYGQLVPSSRPAFTPDGTTAYVVVDVAGDGSSPNPYSFLYAIDTSESGGGGGTAPAAPTGLAGSTVSSSRIDLTWTDNSANETGFRIERCTGRRCTSFVVVGETGANVTAFSDTGLASTTSYRYRVRSYNATGSSAPSNSVTIKTR
jgi:hypothetical protein